MKNNVKEENYKMILTIETDLKVDNIYKDMDSSIAKEERKQLNSLKKDIDTKEYKKWKKEYLDSEYKKIKNKKFVTCDYLFAGIGSYETTFPEEQWQSFRCWIDANGSAFCGEPREATEEEIKTMIALNAANLTNLNDEETYVEELSESMNIIDMRCEEFSDEGMACGPCGVSGVMGEAVFESDSECKYLSVVWVAETPDALEIDITDETLWPYLAEGKMEEDDIKDLNRIRDAGVSFYTAEKAFESEYASVFGILIEQVKKLVIEKYYDEDDSEAAEDIGMW